MLRLYTYRLLFFKRAWNHADLLVLVASFILFLVGLGVESQSETLAENVTATTGESSNVYSGASSAIAVTRGSRALRGLIVAIRIMRGLRVARYRVASPTNDLWAAPSRAEYSHLQRSLCLRSRDRDPPRRTLVNAGRGTQMAARHVTGENKKRFVDLENNFDLDLVYVTPKLIAMSVPATGTVALYRNPLPEVARFFETRRVPRPLHARRRPPLGRATKNQQNTHVARRR